MFLGWIEEVGGLNYIYFDNIINMVLEECNVEICICNIYENMVNLVFVYVFFDYYFVFCDLELVVLAEVYGGQKIGVVMVGQIFVCFQLVAFGEWLGQGLIVRFVVIIFFQDSLIIVFKVLLLDIVSEVVCNELILQELGLFCIMYCNFGSEVLNIYFILMDMVRKFLVDVVYNCVQSCLFNLIDYIGLINYFFWMINFKVNGVFMGLDLESVVGFCNNDVIGVQFDSVWQYIWWVIGE